MKLKATLNRLLELEAEDSGIPESGFKLGYLLSFVSSPGCATAADMQTEAEKRIAFLEARQNQTAPKP